MDLFVLDRLVMTFAKSLMTSSHVQLVTLTALWAVVEIALPNKKNKKVKK